jgi:hypothetical protein
MLILAHEGYDTARKILYGIDPCDDNFKKAIISSYIDKYPECNVVNCHPLEPQEEIPPTLVTCVTIQLMPRVPECELIIVRRI